MNAFIFKICSAIILLCAIFAEMSVAQERNPTTWPYGGQESEISRVHKSNRTNPLSGLLFTLQPPLDFNKANFYTAVFKDDNLLGADFTYAYFFTVADFNNAKFHCKMWFTAAEFFKDALFGALEVDSSVTFSRAKFYGNADFRVATFKDQTDFEGTTFYHNAKFRSAKFLKGISFNSATIKSKIDFRYALFDNSVIANFSNAVIYDTIFIGDPASYNIQKYDFLRVKLMPAAKEIIPEKALTLNTIIIGDSTSSSRREITIGSIPEQIIEYPGAKIILYGPVDLKMQLEKLAFVQLCDTLDYFAKKDIISVLKEQSFKEDKAAQFELGYMFAKSTMYQKTSVIYETYSTFHPYAWWQFLYNATMGLGYRPFRLIWWTLALILGFGVFTCSKCRIASTATF